MLALWIASCTTAVVFDMTEIMRLAVAGLRGKGGGGGGGTLVSGGNCGGCEFRVQGGRGGVGRRGARWTGGSERMAEGLLSNIALSLRILEYNFGSDCFFSC